MPIFVRDPGTGRFVFNSKAIEALGLSPVELAQRGYPLERPTPRPAVELEDKPVTLDDQL
jgi:PAS domain-containing protein